MTREDLFAAIGTVEISRLARSELVPSSEETSSRRRPGGFTRHLLIAAIIVSLLTVTGCAVVGYVLYDSPEEMISSIFGDKTGYDHKPYTEVPAEDKPGRMYGQPEYDRVEADEKVVREDVAPYVSPVGKSISFKGMTLTVDSFLYDSGTKCGVVTYVLSNPPEYQLGYDGGLFWHGRNVTDFSQYGWDYIIQEKTTEKTLAAAYYFWYNSEMKVPEAVERDFSVGLYLEDEAMSLEALDEKCMEEVKAQYTPEEAIDKAWEITKKWGTEERFRSDIGYFGEEGAAYRLLRDVLYNERAEGVEEASTSPDRITFDCSRSSGIEDITLGDSSIILSPISLRADVRRMDFLGAGDRTDSIDEVIVCFADGTEYLVEGDNADGNSVENRLFANWTPVELTEDADNVFLTIMFNRVIDLDQVTSVKINGTELTRD